MNDEKFILADFSCLFDTDYGATAFLMYKGNNKYFLDGYDKWTEFYLHCRILARDMMNPLTCLLKEEYLSSADNIYNELLDKQWNNVLRVSPQTDIVKLINKIYGSNGSVKVLCRNKMEADHINKYTKWDTIIDDIDITNSSYLFFHNLDSSIARFDESLQAKIIYIYHHKPNFMNYREMIPNISLMPYTRANEIKVIQPYKDIVIPQEIEIHDMEVSNNGKVYSIK